MYLSPRSKKYLLKIYKKKQILFVYKEEKLIGWLFRIPFNQETQEIAGAFIYPEFRNIGIFEKMLNWQEAKSKISVAATFEKMKTYSILSKRNWKKTNLTKILLITNFKFLIKRLTLKRLLSIIKHKNKSGKVIYLVLKK